MEREKRKKIKIGLIICVVVLGLLVLAMNFMKKQERNPITNVGNIEVTVTEKSVGIENFEAILSKLPMKSVTMHEKVQNFALDHLKKVYGRVARASEEEIQKYYEENQREVDEFLYHSNLQNFEKFVASMSKLKSQTLTYVQNEFVLDTFRELQEEYAFEMKIKYENEEDLIYLVHVEKAENGVIDESGISFEVME